jgi:magnesium chelatase family protein
VFPLRLNAIVPALTLAEALETPRIHRVAGLTGRRTAVVTTRPFRAPHHTIADVGLISGGQVPMPGEVSRAHQNETDANSPNGIVPSIVKGFPGM